MKKVIGLAVMMSLATGLLAQENKNAPGGGQEQLPLETRRIVVRTDLVNVLFTVTDKKNRMVLNLSKDDVKVFEDNKPQVIENFSRESDLPLRIAILIDTSNSVRDRLRFEQESAIDFLSSTIRPNKDQAFIVSFDNEPQLLQDYTDNLEKLSAAIRSLQAGGGTGLYEAIYFSAKDKMIFFPPPEPYLRRVMIVVSDGEDNLSARTREEALAMAQRGEVTIFAISTNRSGTARPGDKVLKRLAEETGGQAFFPFAASDLAGDFREIARELRSQYSLAYVSSNKAQDGTFRNITLLPRGKEYRVRAKNGYFAPSQ
ncbi:MAG: VWA domain-containing protein [Acidobacteria bacterium]|nr:VWA domain-containing protein [Acidobacteriota bacterium]